MNQPEIRSKKKREFWTDEQLYLLRIHYTDANPEKVAEMLGRTTLACVAMAGRISIKGKKPRKMTVPVWNRGRFGDALGNHKRVKPIGSTRVNADGILEQKINNGKNRQDRWKRVHRIGCGLAGFNDSDIEPMFADAPPNCYLPGVWYKRRGMDVSRIIIAGSRTLEDMPYSDFVHVVSEFVGKCTGNVEIVSGMARGPDSMGERYAQENGIKCVQFPAGGICTKKRLE